jgi:probable non-F420 flavinoid oxidoreductase
VPSSPEQPVFGFHCSHEQHAPSALLRLAQRSEEIGFAAAMCSDHFHPWTTAQGQSGFAWSWLGAAMQATQMSFGVVCAPGQRYHPAIVAQAAATLCDVFPDRFWMAVGSGEALNESVTGAAWPPKDRRHARLRACVDVMRALWAGETVTCDGLVSVRNAALYSRPARPPLLAGAALTPETARWIGGWADALITVSGPRDRMRAIRDAFFAGGGEGKPTWLQVPISFAATDEESRRIACEQWRQAALTPVQLADLDSPQAFDEATRLASDEAILRAVRASCDVERQLAWLHDDAQLGYTRVYVHNVNPNQQRFFEGFAGRLGAAARR